MPTLSMNCGISTAMSKSVIGEVMDAMTARAGDYFTNGGRTHFTSNAPIPDQYHPGDLTDNFTGRIEVSNFFLVMHESQKKIWKLPDYEVPLVRLGIKFSFTTNWVLHVIKDVLRVGIEKLQGIIGQHPGHGRDSLLSEDPRNKGGCEISAFKRVLEFKLQQMEQILCNS